MQRVRRDRRKIKQNKGGQPSVGQLLSRATPKSISGFRQALTRIVVPGTPHLLTNTVTTGLLQSVLKLDPCADIENLATRFGADYEEVRCLGVKVMLIALQGNSQGISAYWIDEKYSNAPTLSESQGKTVGWISHSQTTNHGIAVTWKPNDIADEAFVNATAASIGNAAYFKTFTNNANYNAPITATSLFLLQATYVLEFRGIQE
jgi:hypothetical protein